LDIAKQSSILNISRTNPGVNEKQFREYIFELDKLHGEMSHAIYLYRVLNKKSKCINEEIARFKKKLSEIRQKGPCTLDPAITCQEKDLFLRWKEAKSMRDGEQKQNIIDELRDEVQARLEAVELMQDILDSTSEKVPPKPKNTTTPAVPVTSGTPTLLLNRGTTATPARPTALPLRPTVLTATSPAAARVTFLPNTTVASIPTATIRPTPTVIRPTPTVIRPTPTVIRPTPTVIRPTPTVIRPTPTVIRPTTSTTPKPTKASPKLKIVTRPPANPPPLNSFDIELAPFFD